MATQVPGSDGLLVADQPLTKSLLHQRRLGAPLLADGAGLVTAQHAPGGPEIGAAPDAVRAVHDDGGIVLAEAHVRLVFWGTAWGRAPAPTSQQVTAGVARLLASPYLSALGEYRGAGSASLASSVAVGHDPPNPFTDRDVAALLYSELVAGRLPEPDDDPLSVFCVILPRGVESAQLNVLGEHSFFQYYDLRGLDLPAGVDQANVRFIWVTNDGTLDYVTAVFSHALVEACSDPVGTALRIDSDACLQGSWCELADPCHTLGRVDGVLAQSYWSARQQACVLPAAVAASAAPGASGASAAPGSAANPVTPRRSWPARLATLMLPPAFFFWLGLFYLVVLLLLAGAWFKWEPLQTLLPAQMGPVPLAVPWFGALGAVIIGLGGIFDHSEYSHDPVTRWDPSYNFWHVARPLMGAAVGLVGYLMLAAVLNAAGAPNANRPIAYVVAFLFGYREESFRELIKKAADLLLWPGNKTAASASVRSQTTSGGGRP